MEVGTKIDIEALKKNRQMYAEETMAQLYAGGKIKVWSWGLHNILAYTDKNNVCYALRFTVSGRKFRGHIYIVLNGSDLYDVYYCTSHGTIKMIDKDLYCDQLTEVIDEKIEKIPAYRM